MREGIDAVRVLRLGCGTRQISEVWTHPSLLRWAVEGEQDGAGTRRHGETPMDSTQKAKTARILGYICLAVGALNLILTLADREQTGSPLLSTGLSAIGIGIIMVFLGRRRPTPPA